MAHASTCSFRKRVHRSASIPPGILLTLDNEEDGENRSDRNLIRKPSTRDRRHYVLRNIFFFRLMERGAGFMGYGKNWKSVIPNGEVARGIRFLLRFAGKQIYRFSRG